MRLAIPPPVQLALALLLVWLINTLFPGAAIEASVLRIMATVLLIGAVTVIAVAVGLFRRRGTTVDPRAPERTSSLVTDGIYRFTRNPMYLGMLLILLAAVFWTGQFLALPIPILFCWFMTRFQIQPEE
ncbi:MAG: isoprenylcysteine carboxylmethyltransferase family protein, partial [Erythrobacter sp.]|nr:isoprenylcysteine carboxylmethyltransferase family protein [Erythrobacter sp.]